MIMIIDDHSRMIVGGQIFYNDNAYNYQKVLRQAIATYGLPDKLYLDNGSTYSNRQLTHILNSLGIVEIHTPVRDGAAKGNVERNFRTLKMRWLDVLDLSQIHSLEQFIGAKVEIHYLPNHMEDACILFDGVHYPIRPTDKVANSRIRRNNSALQVHSPEESAS